MQSDLKQSVTCFRIMAFRFPRQLLFPLWRGYCSPVQDPAEQLLREICGKIRFQGPMTVAEYMQNVLTHPLSGYYTKVNKENFGVQGDFITSPEISQMFGECLAIWIVMEWRKMGGPTPLQLVELGPGRGTLMQDILRTILNMAPQTLSDVSVHLVEASSKLKQVQEAVLCGSMHTDPVEGVSKFGPQVKWYPDLRDIPRGFTFFLANEFFDALPIHQFVRGHEHWHEVLVDVQDAMQGHDLRFVKSKERTPNTVLINPNETRDCVEISAKSGVIIRSMCDRIRYDGGCALIIDYGHNGTGQDTLRAFKQHRGHDPLLEPGTADLTADVDFNYLKQNCSESTIFYGPVDQGRFLKHLGIDVRKDHLLKSAESDKVKQDIESAFKVLTAKGDGGMGSRFKVCSIFPKSMSVIHEKYPPLGFN